MIEGLMGGMGLLWGGVCAGLNVRGSQPSLNNDAEREYLINQSDGSALCLPWLDRPPLRSHPLIPSRSSAKEQRCKVLKSESRAGGVGNTKPS